MWPSPVVPHAGFHQLEYARPSLHHFRVGIVAARGENDALARVGLEVAVGVAGDNAGHAAVGPSCKLHCGRREAQVNGVVVSGFGDVLHFEANVHAGKTRTNAGIGRQSRRIVEAKLGINEGRRRREARGGRLLLNLGDHEAVGTLVEYFLPEIGRLTRTVGVDARGFRASAVVRRAVDFIEQRGLVDFGAFLALRVHGAEALEAGASASHLFKNKHVCAQVGSLQAGDKATNAGTNDNDVEVFGALNFVCGDFARFKGDWAAGAGARGLARRHKAHAIFVDVLIVGGCGVFGRCCHVFLVASACRSTAGSDGANAHGGCCGQCALHEVATREGAFDLVILVHLNSSL